MDQEKRLMIAFALSFAVLMLWRVLLVKPPPPTPKAPQVTTGQPQGQNPSQASGVKSASTASKESSLKPGAKEKSEAPPAIPVQQGSKAEDIVVENDLYKVTLSTQGAVVKSWVLKKYRDQTGKPLDVVDTVACGELGFPMSILLADPSQTPAANADVSQKLNSAFYIVKAANASSTPGNNAKLPDQPSPAGPPYATPVSLEFVYSDGAILSRKQFVFGPAYEIHVEVNVSSAQHDLPVGVRWPGGFGDHSLTPALVAATNLAYYQTTDSTKVHEERFLGPSFFSRLFGTAPQNQTEFSVNGPLASAGLEDRFFAEAFLPNSPDVAFHLTRQVWTPAGWQGQDKDKPRPLEATLATPDPKALSFQVVVTPKDLQVLRSLKPPLDGLVDYGFFSFFAKPLFLGLRFIHDHWVGNYGWAIVILTILINFAMFPLKVKSIRSAQQMQKIAPLVKTIQDRYKQYKFNDPRKQRMNQEVMDLYKKHGVNPLGGCLPMAVQLPFLYGFWRVLDLSIELRHAPWILWITDLSAPDPFHLFGFRVPILPILMMVTMFVLQKMTPMATVDPGQKRMMMLMPLIFGVMFFNLASGLVLYYTTANIVGIAQQVFINRTVPIQNLVPAPAKDGNEEV